MKCIGRWSTFLVINFLSCFDLMRARVSRLTDFDNRPGNKVGSNPIESLYNARFDPSKRIVTAVVPVAAAVIPPTPVKATLEVAQ